MNSGTVFKAYNNILAGQGQFVANFFPLQTDTAGNLKQPVFALIGFADPNNYNYRITDDSPAHNIGIPAGLSSSGYPLVAWDEYVHPTGRTVRCQHALLDAGAFETCTTDALVLVDHPWMIWPNPAHDRVNINALAGAKIVLIDAQGRLLRTMQSTGMNTIELLGIASGIYVLRVEHNGARTDEKLIIE